MYLLVFVTLIISMVGVYAQVIAVQTARMFAQQNGVAQAMVTWQSAAVSMAGSIIRTNPVGYNAVIATGCSLTFNILPGFAGPRCPVPTLVAPGTDVTGTVTDGSATGVLNLVYSSGPPTPHNECVHLPATCTSGASGCTSCTPFYDTKNYQFYSILFRSGGYDYVFTIVPGTTGFITMAKGNTIGLTTANLMQQLQNTTTSNLNYGYVNASSQLVTSLPQATANPITITLPAFTSSPGAVAIVGSPD